MNGGVAPSSGPLPAASPATPALSVVLPAREEARNLERLLPALLAALRALGVPFDVSVVDVDPSLDDTAAVCARWGVTRLPRQPPGAYGDAVRTGLAATRGEWVLMMDADGSHDPGEIAGLWARRDPRGVVVASRYAPGGRTEVPVPLTVTSRLLNGAYRAVLGVPCADMSNSFRLYPGAPLRAVRLTSRHFDVLEEVLVRLLRADPGFRIHEVPTVFVRRRAGVSKRQWGRFVVGYVGTLVRLARVSGRLDPAPPR